MPDTPPKRPPRPQISGGTPQQARTTPQADYHNIPINDSHEDSKLQGAILLQPEMSPMLAEMQSPYQPTSVALETKDMFTHRWLHSRARLFSYFQIFCAVVLLVVGIVSVVVKPSYNHVGVGFWLAVFTAVTATSGLLAAHYKTQELVGVFLVMSIVTVFLSFCGLIVVSVGLNADLHSHQEVAEGHLVSGGNSSLVNNQQVVMSDAASRNGSVPTVTSSSLNNQITDIESEYSPASKISTGVFLVIAVSTEMILALLSWLTCWQALCGSRTKGDCVTEAMDFCSDTVCFCCTT